MPEQALCGRRILVVEDEYFLADDLHRALKAAGAIVLGPVPSVEAALDLVGSKHEVDSAVLDIALGGKMAYPIADALAERNVTFIFVTGYDHTALPERHTAVRRLQKPLDVSATLSALEHIFAAADATCTT